MLLFLLDMRCSMCFCLYRIFHILFFFFAGYEMFHTLLFFTEHRILHMLFFAKHRMFQYCRVEVQTKNRRICLKICLLLKVIYIFAAGSCSCQGTSH